MNWQKWKMGLFVAALTSLLGALVGLSVDLTPKQMLILIGGSFAKDVLLFLKSNPIPEETTTLTTTTTLTQPAKPAPPENAA